MSGFEGVQHRKALDVLTTLVMLEHCPPDETVVTVIMPTNQRGKLHADMPPIPIEHTWCLRCLLMKSARGAWGEDGKAGVVRMVKEHKLHIVAAGPMSDMFRCPVCAKPPVVNPNWLQEFGKYTP